MTAPLEAIEKARATRGGSEQQAWRIIINVVGNGIDGILDSLRIAKRKYPTDEQRVRWELQPWVVEAALARFGKRRLTEAEQREVLANTRTPEKMKWPDWWTVRA